MMTTQKEFLANRFDLPMYNESVLTALIVLDKTLKDLKMRFSILDQEDILKSIDIINIDSFKEIYDNCYNIDLDNITSTTIDEVLDISQYYQGDYTIIKNDDNIIIIDHDCLNYFTLED